MLNDAIDKRRLNYRSLNYAPLAYKEDAMISARARSLTST
jgi:hypothetical protein